MSQKKRIYLSPPHMSGEEERYVAEAFRTNWIAPLGPLVDAFEEKLAAYVGAAAWGGRQLGNCGDSPRT